MQGMFKSCMFPGGFSFGNNFDVSRVTYIDDMF